MRKLLLLTLLLGACTTSSYTPRSSTSQISASAFQAHVNFLASDLLEGREAGTRGYDIAAAYVATQFELVGLAPGGDNDTYVQKVPMLASWREAEQVGLTLIQNGREEALTFKQDFLVSSSVLSATGQLEADAVFAGFGIDAPSRGHSDYAGLDVQGKIVVTLSGFPRGWPSEEGAYYSSGATKSATAERNGAVAIITVYTDALEKRAPWSRMTRNTNRMRLSWVGQDGQPHTSAPGIRLGGMMSPDASARLFELAETDYATVRAEAAEGAPHGFPLNVRLRLKGGNRFEDRMSANVAGIVRGTDPALKNEYVVISAHLDHLGIASAVDGDSIYNGALDNAAGVAAMIEAARALNANPPRRSVMFLAVTAEEKGLLGAQYFTLNPTVPIESIVANVNLDMPVLTYDFDNVIGFGSSHSSLEDTLSESLGSMGLGLASDPFPQQAIFVRSDHFRFVQQGVPSIMLATGTDSADGPGKGLEAFNDFLANHYHQPSDDLTQSINYDVGAKFAEVNFRLLSSIANADAPPRWNDGDFFGELFGR